MIHIPDHIHQIKPYQPGKPIQEIRRELNRDTIAKLGSNENPLGPSPRAIQAIQDISAELHWYPEPACIDVRRKIAEYNQVEMENVIVGNGSEGVLSYLMKTIMEPEDEIVTAAGTFIGIYVLAMVHHLNCKKVPLTSDLKYDLNGIADSIGDQTKMVYLANPNNPTGTAFTKTEFEAFMNQVPGHVLVILDEAYYEYAIELMPDYPVGCRYDYPNLLSLRTYSKSYGLAGLRFGYGIGQPELIASMMKVKLPFEPSILAQAAGIAALDDVEFLKKTVDLNTKSLNYFYSELDNMGLSYGRSAANFVCVDFERPDRVARLTSALLNEGVIVRPISAFGLPNHIRISTGTMDENKMAMEALKKSLAEMER